MAYHTPAAVGVPHQQPLNPSHGSFKVWGLLVKNTTKGKSMEESVLVVPPLL